METNNKKLIVVLGMHRSGTSAITRGLQVLGVSLGDRMIPPVEDNNPKGFWEDMDLNALNIEMLSALDSDWCRVTPVNSNEYADIFFARLNCCERKLTALPFLALKTRV